MYVIDMYIYVCICMYAYKNKHTQGMLTGSWTTKINKRRFLKIIGSET